MGLLSFLSRRLLFKDQEYDRGAIAPGPCLHRYFNRSFVVPAERFTEIMITIERAIASCLPDQDMKRTIIAHTGEGNRQKEIPFDDPEELSTIFNAADNRLTSVLCRVTTETMGSLVHFQDYAPGWTAAIVVEGGTDDRSQELLEDLTGYVKETFQWYSFLRFGKFVLNVIVLVGISLLLLGYLVSRQSSPVAAPEPSDLTTIDRVLGIFWDVVGVAIAFIVFTLMRKIINALFPRGTFLIGQEVHRHKSRIWWRKILLTSLVLPLLFALYRTFGQ